MQNIVIDKKGSQIYSQRSLLIIQHPSFGKPLSIPLSQIQSLTITTQVDLSSTLLTRLSENNVSLCVLPSGRTGEACFLLGGWHAAIERRIQQYDVIHQVSSRRYWASVLVRLKLHQQADVLIKLKQHCTSATTPSSDTASDCIHSAITESQLVEIDVAIKKLKSLRDKFRRHYPTTSIPSSHPSRVYNDYTPHYQIASLLGTEGIGSAIYFNGYQQFFADDLQFRTRNRRPPKDPVNVVLSLSYTLLQHLYQQALYSVGFDPYYGVLHSPSYGRQSLACDFVELQRSTIDFWVWTLFEQRILILEDFSISGNSGISDDSNYPCELLKSGRSKFYKAFSGIRPMLSKHALSHAWLWQNRIQRYHSDKTLSPSLSFVSHHPESSQPAF
ncbi:CRISPR-associated endonuclease Cas1 [Psychrobacter piscatorii]|uniref:CRISPR-associated endonuclease Cas1 n=1 Tax=Psychrobacter piscatorii TaxID=554343 RepID=UPI00373558A5